MRYCSDLLSMKRETSWRLLRLGELVSIEYTKSPDEITAPTTAIERARAARNTARREHNLSPLAGEVAQDWLLQREESEGGLQPYQLRHGSIMERL